MRHVATLLLAGFLAAVAGSAQADSRADYEAAVKALRANKRDDAIKLLTKIIDSGEVSGRTLATMHYMRADIYGQTGKYDLALADYAKVIELVPDHAPAFGDRAVILALQKKYQEALDDLARAQFLLPRSPVPYFNRGRVYELMGRKADAIEQYRAAKELAPQFKEAQDALKRLGAS